MKYNNAKRVAIMLVLFSIMSAACADRPVFSPEAEKSRRPNRLEMNVVELLELHNRARIQGTRCLGSRRTVASTLTWSNKLSTAAKGHAHYMASTQKLSHTGRDGFKVAKRIENANYQWLSVGENIAYGYKNMKNVMPAWLKSKPHCANIMNDDFTQMGGAEVDGYWVTVFASPKSQ